MAAERKKTLATLHAAIAIVEDKAQHLVAHRYEDGMERLTH